ncbi:hypothetical protein Golax_022152 [Gossypium laxum]|uniref:No apical meristem-associated C-terminal domain-containing protein n=1 Tax=Gossypium laxum TaxID=34288 RepID=A0A7J9AQ98_9ROSI|nr:hypothetical protein [Gossypium laxum]
MAPKRSTLLKSHQPLFPLKKKKMKRWLLLMKKMKKMKKTPKPTRPHHPESLKPLAMNLMNPVLIPNPTSLHRLLTFSKKGEDRTFSKAHEQKAFELSKKIWGKEGVSGKLESSTAKSNGKAKGNNKAVAALKAGLPSSSDKKRDKAVPIDVDKVVSKSSSSLLDMKFCVSDVDVGVVKVGLDMVDGEKKAAVEAKWRKLQMAQLELFAERTEFVAEQANLALIYYKSEDE